MTTMSGPEEPTVAHMKWYGWGVEGVSFHHEDKPALAEFVQRVVGVDLHQPAPGPLELSDLPVAPSRIGADLRADLADAVGATHVRDDDPDRVVHTYGKSLRDLLRLRAGDIPRVPDLVVYPGDEAQVQLVVDRAVAGDAVLIPFGGGSNIVGSLEPLAEEQRPVISIDLGRLNQVLDVDAESDGRVQGGASRDERLPDRMRDYRIEAEPRETPDLHKLAQLFISMARSRAEQDRARPAPDTVSPVPGACRDSEVESDQQEAND